MPLNSPKEGGSSDLRVFERMKTFADVQQFFWSKSASQILHLWIQLYKHMRITIYDIVIICRAWWVSRFSPEQNRCYFLDIETLRRWTEPTLFGLADTNIHISLRSLPLPLCDKGKLIDGSLIIPSSLPTSHERNINYQSIFSPSVPSGEGSLVFLLLYPLLESVRVVEVHSLLIVL